ncbi:MAG: hypothetical protein IT195_01915 [Microthrixaceae bacterium]|nr:hypothetical protein [Microthrixaceae bacterium]
MATGETRGGGLLVVSSAGGVLLDVLALARAYSGRRRHVVVDSLDTCEELQGEEVVFRPEPALRKPHTLLAESLFAWRSLRRSRPDLLLSAGTALAVPWFLVAAVLRIPRVWVETLNIIDTQGLAARICARNATLVAVQHDERVGIHLRTVMVGELM